MQRSINCTSFKPHATATNARIILDSIDPNGRRLTTMEVTFPRIILAEFNTHRVFSRNSASSRAIPTTNILQRVAQTPFIPTSWGRNRAGMSAVEEIDPPAQREARATWLRARDAALTSAQQLLAIGVHKQTVNRLLEPFLFHVVLVTSTDWDNFFNLRCTPQAQPEMRAAADAMRDAFTASTPTLVEIGAWHLPLLQPDEMHLDLPVAKAVSSARCARISYLTHDGIRDIDKDIALATRLVHDGHLSPFEHVATPADDDAFHANFQGWIQYRAEVERAHS